MTPPRWGYSFRSSDFSGEGKRDSRRRGPNRYPEPDDSGDPCIRGIRCAGRRTDLETREQVPARAALHLCPACRLVLEQCLEALPACYARLATLSADPVKAGRAVRVPPGSRVLANPEADALMRETASVTGGWAARVRAVPGLQLSRHGYPHGSQDQVTADCRTLALQRDPLLALPVAPMSRTWTWPAGNPMPADLETEIGTLERLRGGDGWVTALTALHGGDGGCEIIDLRHRATRLLRENPAAPEFLDGIPCRSCDAYALVRASLPAGPEDPRNPPPFSECSACRDRMTREEYDDWVKLNGAHARHDASPVTCRRCRNGDCHECAWSPCACTAGPHPRRRAAA